MDWFSPKYRRNPNEKIQSLYCGVANGSRTVTTVVKPSVDRNRMEATPTYGPGLERGQGGQIAVLILGGMETTLAEIEYILEEKRQRPFIPRRKSGEIAAMCQRVQARRNEMIEHWRKYFKANPSEMPRKKKRVRIYLPVGYHMVPTSEPGLKILVRK